MARGGGPVFYTWGRDKNEERQSPRFCWAGGKVSRSSDAGASPGRSQQHWILVMCILARNPTSPAPVIAKGRLLRGARALRAVSPAARAAWASWAGSSLGRRYSQSRVTWKGGERWLGGVDWWASQGRANQQGAHRHCPNAALSSTTAFWSNSASHPMGDLMWLPHCGGFEGWRNLDGERLAGARPA